MGDVDSGHLICVNCLVIQDHAELAGPGPLGDSCDETPSRIAIATHVDATGPHDSRRAHDEVYIDEGEPSADSLNVGPAFDPVADAGTPGKVSGDVSGRQRQRRVLRVGGGIP
jgi:hypothetical protein